MNVPWLNFVEIDFDDDVKVDLQMIDLSLEVVPDQFFFSWVKPESGRNARLYLHLSFSLLFMIDRSRERNVV